MEITERRQKARVNILEPLALDFVDSIQEIDPKAKTAFSINIEMVRAEIDIRGRNRAIGPYKATIWIGPTPGGHNSSISIKFVVGYNNVAQVSYLGPTNTVIKKVLDWYKDRINFKNFAGKKVARLLRIAEQLMTDPVKYRVYPGEPALMWAKRMHDTYGFGFDPSQSSVESALIWPLPKISATQLEKEFTSDSVIFKRIG